MSHDNKMASDVLMWSWPHWLICQIKVKKTILLISYIKIAAIYFSFRYFNLIIFWWKLLWLPCHFFLVRASNKIHNTISMAPERLCGEERERSSGLVTHLLRSCSTGTGSATRFPNPQHNRQRRARTPDADPTFLWAPLTGHHPLPTSWLHYCRAVPPLFPQAAAMLPYYTCSRFYYQLRLPSLHTFTAE